jgi:histidine phosphotransferase ChpT
VSDRDLTALVGSRICHDLVSPLGAIGNGLELLQMAGTTGAAELALISDSLETATARIRFFRIAYGDAQPDQTLSRSEVAAALRHGLANPRLSLAFEPVEMNRQTARLMCLALQCLETAMPYGGTIRVSLDQPALTLHAEAERLAREDALWASLTAAQDDYPLRPGQVQFGLLRAHATKEGRALQVHHGDGRISIML